MKNLLLPILVFFTVHVFAQVPQSFKYQAVIRDSENAIISNNSVGMQVSILQLDIEGTAVYVERHFPSSNSAGVVAVNIGEGIAVSGSFSGIDWSNGPYFLKVETDLNGGANYTISGTSQLMSVPYALHAAVADSAINAGVSGTETAFDGWDKNAEDDFDGDYNSLSNVPDLSVFSTTDTTLTEDEVMSIVNANFSVEFQNLTFENTTLRIDNGNAVDLSSLKTTNYELLENKPDLSVFSTTDTTLTADEVMEIVNSNIHIETPELTLNNDILSLSTGSMVDLSGYNNSDYLSLQNLPDLSIYVTQDTTLSEEEVMAIVNRHFEGGSQQLSLDGDSLRISNGNAVSLSGIAGVADYNNLMNLPDLSIYSTTDTTLSADEVMAIVNANFESINQELSLENDTLRLTNGGEIDMLPYKNNDYNELSNLPDLSIYSTTDTTLSDEEVMAILDANNIVPAQTLELVDDTLELSNGGGRVDLSKYDNSNYESLTNKPNLSVFTTEQDVLNILEENNYATEAFVRAIKESIYNEMLNAGLNGLVTDNEGRTYKTIKYGNQVWMTENLKTRHFNNGDTIPTSYPYLSETSAMGVYHWPPAGDDEFIDGLGILYTWHAANDSRRICPEGWRMPTEADWTALFEYFRNNDFGTGGNSDHILPAICSNEYWETSSTAGAPGYQVSSNNSADFNIVPAGYKTSICPDQIPENCTGAFNDFGTDAYYWTASGNASNGVYINIDSDSDSEIIFSRSSGRGLSVRCIKQ